MLLLLLLLFPLVSFAAISDEDYLKRNLDSIKRDESVAIKNELGKLTEWKFKDLEEVEKFVYGINPELVESVKSMSDVEKSAEYKSWLAQKTYEDFFDKYLQELRSYSEKLGKKIKYTKVGKKGKKITLKKFDEKIDDFDDENDGGVRSFSLSTDDLKDCHKIITTKREKVCYEPDGYIRYQIDYKDTDVATKNIKTFTVSKDVPEENRSSYYYFKLESQDRKIVLSDGSVRLLRGYDLSFNAVDPEQPVGVVFMGQARHQYGRCLCHRVYPAEAGEENRRKMDREIRRDQCPVRGKSNPVCHYLHRSHVGNHEQFPDPVLRQFSVPGDCRAGGNRRFRGQTDPVGYVLRVYDQYNKAFQHRRPD